MLSNKRQPRPSVPSSLCQGVIFCGECGRRVCVRHLKQGHRKYQRYGCNARVYRADQRYRLSRGTPCDMPYFPVEQVDKLVWDNVENLVNNPATLWEAVYGKKAQSGREALSRRVADLSRQLNQAKAQEDRAARLYTLGTDSTTAERQVKEASARRRAVDQELAQAKASCQRDKINQDAKELAFETLIALRGKMDDLTLEEKRRVLHLLVPGGLTHRIELHEDGSVLVTGIVDFSAETRAMSMPYSKECYLK
jgi:site-specific DNA recombinase